MHLVLRNVFIPLVYLFEYSIVHLKESIQLFKYEFNTTKHALKEDGKIAHQKV